MLSIVVPFSGVNNVGSVTTINSSLVNVNFNSGFARPDWYSDSTHALLPNSPCGMVMVYVPEASVSANWIFTPLPQDNISFINIPVDITSPFSLQMLTVLLWFISMFTYSSNCIEKNETPVAVAPFSGVVVDGMKSYATGMISGSSSLSPSLFLNVMV